MARGAKGRFIKRKRVTRKRRRTTKKGDLRRTSRRAYSGLRKRRRRTGGSVKNKGLMEKQGGAFLGAGALTFAMKKGMIPPLVGTISTPMIAAGLLAAATMWNRNNILLGASLGVTGMAAAAAIDAFTTAGLAGPGQPGRIAGQEAFAHSTYRPAEELLGFETWDDEYDDDELLGEEEYEYIDEIDL